MDSTCRAREQFRITQPFDCEQQWASARPLCARPQRITKTRRNHERVGAEVSTSRLVSTRARSASASSPVAAVWKAGSVRSSSWRGGGGEGGAFLTCVARTSDAGGDRSCRSLSWASSPVLLDKFGRTDPIGPSTVGIG